MNLRGYIFRSKKDYLYKNFIYVRVRQNYANKIFNHQKYYFAILSRIYFCLETTLHEIAKRLHVIIRSMIKLIITKLNRSRKARDAAGKGKRNKVVRNRYTEPSGSTRRSSDNRERHVPDLNG